MVEEKKSCFTDIDLLQHLAEDVPTQTCTPIETCKGTNSFKMLAPVCQHRTLGAAGVLECNMLNASKTPEDLSIVVQIIPNLLWIKGTLEGTGVKLELILLGTVLSSQMLDVLNPTVDFMISLALVKAEIKIYLHKPTKYVKYVATACYRRPPTFQWACAQQEGNLFTL